MKREKGSDYVNNQEFYELLCKAIPYFREKNEWGPYGNKVGKIILQMIYRIKNKSSFKNYGGYHWELMCERALINVFTYIKSYNLTKTNPFSYFTTIIINAFKNALSEMSKQKTEISYDTFIIGEIIDETEFLEFEDDLIKEIDQELLIKNDSTTFDDLKKFVDNIVIEEEKNIGVDDE
jgi:hypothetical protein